jgi:hypothetical protein
MVEIEVTMPREVDGAAVERTVEGCAARLGLQVTMKGTLGRYPGCIHWHFKRGRERGTLEVTWWPREQRLWLSVQAGRTGDWIDAVSADLKAALEDAATWR